MSSGVLKALRTRGSLSGLGYPMTVPFCDDASDYMDVPGFGVVPISLFRSPVAAGNTQIKGW